jgi:DNA-binding beta-propeller fold protein YncE
MADVAAKPNRLPLVVLGAVIVVAVVAVAFAAFGSDGTDRHEIWSLDQGTDRIHVYDDEHTQVAVIDVSPAALREVAPDFDPEAGRTVPHMIEFDSQDRYAFIAATAGAATIVIDAVDREVVAVLPTGGGSHMAAVAPDDDAVWVAAIGAQQLVEIPLDLDADEPTFEIGRQIDVEPLLADTGYDYPSFSPVCHQYDGEGRAWVTLGPGIEQGGLFVFDTEDAEVVHAYDPTEVRANCGIGFTDDNTRAVANWSGLFGADIDDEEGEWYVFDTDTFELIQTASSDGVDAHGVRITPDGDAFWQVNRGSDDGQIIDASTFEVVGEIDAGDTPDILDFSPDGRYAYITQRGPSPLSGDPHVAVGSEAGLLVVDVETGEHVTFLATPEVTDSDGEVVNDVHGVGVRTTTGDERVVSAAPANGVTATAFSCHVPA